MLRKLVIVLIALSLAAGTASAQLLPSFGVKGGLNFSNINVSDFDASTRTGFVGGGFVNLAWPGLNLQGEVLYTTKGFKQGAVLATQKSDYRVHFIEIPVMLRIGLPVPAVTPAVYIGPAISFPLKAEIKPENGDWVDVKDDAESSVWSLVFGAEVTLMDTLIVELRYDLGMGAIHKASVGESVDLEEDVKDRTLSLMAGIKF
jgi:opacity protein-like surface antigen